MDEDTKTLLRWWIGSFIADLILRKGTNGTSTISTNKKVLQKIKWWKSHKPDIALEKENKEAMIINVTTSEKGKNGRERNWKGRKVLSAIKGD